MDITTFEYGDMTVKVHVNMGTEIAIYNSFQDVDGSTFESHISFLNIDILERILQIAKEAQARHNLIVGKDS
ncbi:MAG TPA: hypothetical protein VEP90_28370 [Methylomirabilota bacterium]|nr:hypothetical protein [Methylomirabilota bacterium]